jgi:hypothetical protein
VDNKASNNAPIEITRHYRDIKADDFDEGFFARKSTDSYIEALASLEAVTLYAGAGVSADVGAPLNDELMPWVLLRLLGDADTDLTDVQHQHVVSALRKSYSPTYLGSIAREHERLRGDVEDPGKRSTFVHHLNTALAAGRNPGGFLARSLGAMAFSFKSAANGDVTVFTTNYDNKICEEEKKIRKYFPDLSGYSFKPCQLSSAENPTKREIPLYHLNGDLKAHEGAPSGPLVIGEADFFGRHGFDLRPQTDDHTRRSELLDSALTQTACLFVGSSLTDPDVLAKLADTKYLQLRYAFVLAPMLQLRSTEERAEALNLIAQRFLHLGIVPIIIDFPHQVPQLLIEVALRLQQGKAYKRHVRRLDDWWRAWATKFGFSRTYGKDGGKRDEELQQTWMTELAKVRSKISRKHLNLPSNLRDRDEQIQIEVWLRHPATRSLILWATSEGIWLQANTAHRCLIYEGDDFAAQSAFRQGQAVYGSIDPARGRWRYQISVPLVLHKPPWHHLPVGVVSVLSSKGPAVRDESGTIVEPGGKLSGFVESPELAERLAEFEDDIKKAVNYLLDPNSKRWRA